MYLFKLIKLNIVVNYDETRVRTYVMEENK